ncbi:MAG: dihydrolipoamide acetyltransferase family protein, partial [Acidimicrobiia bacterium]
AGPEERVPVRGVRRLIAEKMVRSAREIPHVTTFLTVDATALGEARQKLQEKSGAKVTALAVVAKAFLSVCKQHPKLNSRFDDESREIVLKRYYHLGIATDTERGLVVPVIKDADSMSVEALASEIARLSAAVREGSAQPDDVRGSTVTITNVGTFHAEYGTPIINWPEAAILALGEIQERPAVKDGKVVVRPQVTFSLSFDHRVMDGAEAGRALYELKQQLEDAEALGDLVETPGGT